MILAILVIFVILPFWITRNILYSWDLCEICRLCQALLCLSSFKFKVQKVQSVIKFVIPAIPAILVTIFFFKNKKISCYFCNYCKICRLLRAFLCISSFKYKVLLNLWFLLVLWSFFTFVVLAKFADFSRAFFTFLLYTTELLLNLLCLRYLLL